MREARLKVQSVPSDRVVIIHPWSDPARGRGEHALAAESSSEPGHSNSFPAGPSLLLLALFFPS